LTNPEKMQRGRMLDADGKEDAGRYQLGQILMQVQKEL
jgi:predicted NAD-dependent protein-ADP-ribosyltransferase YbiA (DUF1768 family)